MIAATTKLLMLDDGQLVSLRAAIPADAENLLMHTRTVLADGAGMCRTSSEFDMTLSDEERWIRSHVDDPRKLLLVAEAGGKIIGVLDCHPLPRQMLEHVTEFGMSIHPDWRGQGIGRTLMEGLLEWARTAPGLRKLTLSVRADNAAAIALYEKHGFQEEGRRVDQICLGDGGAVDEVLMYKFVD